MNRKYLETLESWNFFVSIAPKPTPKNTDGVCHKLSTLRWIVRETEKTVAKCLIGYGDVFRLDKKFQLYTDTLTLCNRIKIDLDGKASNPIVKEYVNMWWEVFTEYGIITVNKALPFHSNIK